MPQNYNANRIYKNTSDVWIFFNKILNGGVCKMCEKEVRGGGGTSNLRNHVKRRHNKIWTAHLQNRLDHTTLTVLPGSIDNDSLSLDGVRMVEEETSQVMEGVEAVQALQAYASQDGGTVIFLQPQQLDHQDHHQNVVLMEQHGEDEAQEASLSNGGSGDPEDQNRTMASAVLEEEEASASSSGGVQDASSPPPNIVKIVGGGPRKIATLQPNGNRVAGNYVLKRLTGGGGGQVAVAPRPKPAANPDEEDSFDHFGKYLASLLRNLPSRKAAYKLQKEMISWALQEQLRLETAWLIDGSQQLVKRDGSSALQTYSNSIHPNGKQRKSRGKIKVCEDVAENLEECPSTPAATAPLMNQDPRNRRIVFLSSKPSEAQGSLFSMVKAVDSAC